MPLAYEEGQDARLLYNPQTQVRAHPYTSFDLSHVCERAWCAATTRRARRQVFVGESGGPLRLSLRVGKPKDFEVCLSVCDGA